MNLNRFLTVAAALASITACSSDNTSPKLVTPGPHAWIHFVNAVPDTGALDFRFTDAVSGVPNVEFVNLAFRGGTGVGYQNVDAGTHHIRVFQSSGLSNFDPTVVSTVLGDTTFTFADGTHYTFVFYGSARAGTQKFLILTDNFTIPTSGILMRALNTTTAAADFYAASGTTAPTTVSGTATFANVAPATATAYSSLAAASSTGGWTVAATAAGTTTPLLAAAVMPNGTAGTPEVTGVSGALAALPGARITGSIYTTILFPASVAGSKAASFTSPGLVFMADRYCTNTTTTATC